MSEHKNVDAAFAAAWADFPQIIKDATNPHFKSGYVTLDGLLKAVSPALSKHGLAVRFDSEPWDGGWLCTYAYVLFGAGETKEDRWSPPGRSFVPSGETAQKQGASYTYGRRYALEALLGIAGSEDDDGNTAEQAPPRGKPTSKREQKQRSQQQKESGIGADGLPLGWKEEKTGHFGASGKFAGWTWREIVEGKKGDNPCEPGGERWQWMMVEMAAAEPTSNLEKMLKIVTVAVERAADQRAAEQE